MSLLPSTVHTLDALAARHRGRAPSLVLGVGQHGSVDHVAGAAGTQYRIGSITKTFTAVLVLQLRDEGRLDLDDPIDRHLPGAPAVTIRQLLTHTAGLPAEPVGPWWERSAGVDVATLLAGLPPLAAEPGTLRHYSNLGYGLLGALVERLAGQPWRDRLRERALEPLGLTRTTYGPVEPYARGYVVHPWLDTMRAEPTPDTGAMAPAGQLWSTVGDLLVWARLLAGGHPDVLGADTALEMRTATVETDVPGQRGGLGPALTDRDGREFVGHAGSMPGFRACLAVHPPTGRATVAFANSYTGVETATLTHRALEAVLDAPAGGDELAGSWWWMGQQAIVGRDGDRLVVREDEDTLRLEPAGPDRWRSVEGSPVEEFLTVERDTAGLVTGWEIPPFRYLRDPLPLSADRPGGRPG